MDRAEMIAEICSIEGELIQLDVYPESINFARTNDDELAEELEAVSEQLARRKKFLGENFEKKRRRKIEKILCKMVINAPGIFTRNSFGDILRRVPIGERCQPINRIFGKTSANGK